MGKELIITKTLEFKATVAEVWDALTNPEQTKKFMFGCEVVSDWKKGGSIAYKTGQGDTEMVHVIGKILEIEPGKLLKCTTFGPHSGMEDKDENYLHATYELSEKNRGTELKITQTNFNGDEKRYNETVAGWEFACNGLRQLLEG